MQHLLVVDTPEQQTPTDTTENRTFLLIIITHTMSTHRDKAPMNTHNPQDQDGAFLTLGASSLLLSALFLLSLDMLSIYHLPLLHHHHTLPNF
jgi:hypothetical protein